MVIAAAAAGGPNWTDIMTAFGTVGAVIAAVMIALVTGLLSRRQLRREHERSDFLLAEQREQEKAAVEDERAYGKAQLEEERRLAQEREQLAQAYLVQVVLAEHAPPRLRSLESTQPRSDVTQLAVMVVNRGSFTITRVDMQFCLGNILVQPRGYERMSGFNRVDDKLRAGYAPAAERPLRGVLTPFDAGIRFESGDMHERDLASPYPVVRWNDHWGTRWEHKRGVVRRIADDTEWGQ